MESNEEKLVRLKKKLLELKQSMSIPELIPGKWYYVESAFNWLVLLNEVKDYHLLAKASICLNDGDYYAGGHHRYGKIVRPATEIEIKSALEKEAIKRGFKAGVNVRYPKADWPYNSVDGLVITLSSSVFKYSIVFDELHDGNRSFYRNGKWAEIVKDDVIKICGKEVVIHPRANDISIDGALYSRNDLEALRRIMLEGQVKGLVVGCNSQETIGIDVIERILAKFNP